MLHRHLIQKYAPLRHPTVLRSWSVSGALVPLDTGLKECINLMEEMEYSVHSQPVE